MDSPVTVDQLRVIATIAETGSFSSAARKLGRTQGAISYNVATLEGLLEVELFKREGRRPVLTEAGKALLARARGVLERVDELHAAAKAIRDGLESSLSLAVDTLLPASVLAAILPEFRQRYPTVELDLRTGILSAVTSLVEAGTCGVGITGVATLTDHFVVTSCGSVQLVAVAAPDHPLATRAGSLSDVQLRGHTNIVLSDHTDSPSQETGVRSRSVWRINDSSVRHELVRAGLGWARMPEEQVREDLRQGRLVQLRPERWPELTTIALRAVYLAKNPPGRAGRWLLNRLAEEMIARDR